MRIKRIKGELFRYFVSSRSEIEWHTVDLSERGGQGVCTCHHFRFVANPNFRRINRGRRGRPICIPYGGDEVPTECAHIALAQRVVTERFTKRIQHLARSGTPDWLGRLWSGVTGDALLAELGDQCEDRQDADDDAY